MYREIRYNEKIRYKVGRVNNRQGVLRKVFEVQEIEVGLDHYLPLRDIVFRNLRTAILRGDFQPGERLMENQLADRMGVSRTPIREAIRKLELEGLVVMVPRKGAEVADITEKDINDVLEVRATLEGLAIKLACANMDAEDIEKLANANQAFIDAVNEKKLEEIVVRDIAFHDIIFEASGNEKLIQIINNLREQIYRYRIEYIYNIADHNQLVSEHLQIVDALRKKASKHAVDLAIAHIQTQKKSVIEYTKKNLKRANKAKEE